MAIRSERTPGRTPRGDRDPDRGRGRHPPRPRAEDEERWTAAFAGLRDRVDLVLLAGDLTTHGEPAQAAMVAARRARGVEVPVLAVLGNHDWHADRRDEVVAALREGGIDVLEREHRVLEVGGVELGIAGAKGFVGGFPGSHLPDFGEPLLREVYAESIARGRGARRRPAGDRAVPAADRAAALRADHRDAGGRARADIWTFLGTDRLAAPLREHEPGPRPARPRARRDVRRAARGRARVQRLRAGDRRATSGCSS